MKKICFFLFISTILFATPSWFFNIEPKYKNEIIGYGSGKTLTEAKRDAIADITNTLFVSVDSNVKISSSDIKGKASSSSSVKLHTHSKATLSGVKFLKAEKEDGVWFVAASYDNSPLSIKLKKRLPKNIKNEKQNRYLAQTPLIKKLNQNIGYKLDYEVIRKDNLWQLRYKDIIMPLKEKEFYALFDVSSNNNISLKLNQSIYQINDEMKFFIRVRQAGYVSLLYVEHNGKVGIILANKKITHTMTYPTKNSQDTFSVANPYGKTIKELYVALYSKKPIKLYEFENVSQELLDESNYNFDKLVKKLNNVKFSTFVIKIRK